MNYSARPAWRSQWFAILLAVTLFVLSVPAFILLASGEGFASISFLILILFLRIVFRRLSWCYTVKDERIQSRHGLVSRTIRSIRLQDLRIVNLKQSIFQRILRIGDLEFSSAGGSRVEVAFLGITTPMETMKKVQEVQAKT